MQLVFLNIKSQKPNIHGKQKEPTYVWIYTKTKSP